jgi:beta-lactamase regulating signal transducer with metallopeptidase domain
MTPTTVIWLQLTGILALEISLLAILGALLDRVTQSAAWRRTLWQACLVAAIVVLSLELSGIARAFLPRPKSPMTFRRHVPVATAEFADSPNIDSYRRLSEDFRSFEMEKAHRQPPAMPAPGGFDLTSRIAPPAFAPNPPQAIPVASERVPLDVAVVFVWITGCAAVLGRAVFRRIVFVALRWRWPAVADPHLQDRLQNLARIIGMRKRVRLIESPRLACPVAFGFFRPTIGLQAAFAERFDPSEQDAVLLHELAHLRSGDPFWRFVSDLATALLWWHPLIWWMRNRLEAVSETAADEASLLLSNGPGALAKCLVRLGVQLARSKPDRTPAIAVIGFRSNLGRRVERLVHLDGREWRAPSAKLSALGRVAGTLSLAFATILCTAWVVPAGLNKGENMQTMRHTWKRSLAAFGLLAALGTQNHAAIAGKSDEPASTPANQSAQSTANLTVAPTATSTAPLSYQWYTGDSPIGVSNAQFAAARPGQAATADNFKSSAANQTPGTASDTVGAEESNATGKNQALRTRGFFGPGGTRSAADLNAASKEKLEVEAKLKRIKLDTVAYDGVSLGDVVRHLGDTTARLDPEKIGINFLVRLETQPSPAVTPGAIDPTTGLPVASAPAEAVDLNSVVVRIEPALKQVRLCDVLDAITKVADRPIKYTVEDYGVVFSLDQSKISGPSFSVPAPEQLYVQTFKVDTNTFLAGLDATFGIRVSQFGGPAGPQNIQRALHELLVKLGVNIDTQNKSIFYNQLTGILMVRGTQEDLSLVQAAIETLGGTLFSNAHGPPGFNANAYIGARP